MIGLAGIGASPPATADTIGDAVEDCVQDVIARLMLPGTGAPDAPDDAACDRIQPCLAENGGVERQPDGPDPPHQTGIQCRIGDNTCQPITDCLPPECEEPARGYEPACIGETHQTCDSSEIGVPPVCEPTPGPCPGGDIGLDPYFCTTGAEMCEEPDVGYEPACLPPFLDAAPPVEPKLKAFSGGLDVTCNGKIEETDRGEPTVVDQERTNDFWVEFWFEVVSEAISGEGPVQNVGKPVDWAYECKGGTVYVGASWTGGENRVVTMYGLTPEGAPDRDTPLGSCRYSGANAFDDQCAVVVTFNETVGAADHGYYDPDPSHNPGRVPPATIQFCIAADVFTVNSAAEDAAMSNVFTSSAEVSADYGKYGDGKCQDVDIVYELPNV